MTQDEQIHDTIRPQELARDLQRRIETLADHVDPVIHERSTAPSGDYFTTFEATDADPERAAQELAQEVLGCFRYIQAPRILRWRVLPEIELSSVYSPDSNAPTTRYRYYTRLLIEPAETPTS